MQGNFYEIEQKNMEKIKHVYETKISDGRTN